VLVEGGVNNYELPADVIEALQTAQGVVAEEWLSQMTGRGLPAQQVLDEATTAAGLTN
jgi:hypothetical protein